MKVGDYVRTKHYGICKITDIYNEDKIELDKTNAFGIKGSCYSIENIIKSSPNIIDLIEVGDYVNEKKIINMGCLTNGPEKGTKVIDYYIFPNTVYYFKNEDIKSIVTKEQFSSMEYKVN